MLVRKTFLSTLPPGEASIFFAFKANIDITIPVLFQRIEASNHKLPHLETRDQINRYKQQRVGAYISRLNVRLIPKGWVIKLGSRRGTYRLQRLHK